MTFDQTQRCPQCGWERTVRVDPGGLEQMLLNVKRAKTLAKQYLYQHIRRTHGSQPG